jgi:hypothetical protein
VGKFGRADDLRAFKLGKGKVLLVAGNQVIRARCGGALEEPVVGLVGRPRAAGRLPVLRAADTTTFVS